MDQSHDVPLDGDFTGLLTAWAFAGLFIVSGLLTALPFTGDFLGLPRPCPFCGVPWRDLAAGFGVLCLEPEAALAFGVPLTFSKADFLGLELSPTVASLFRLVPF